MKIRLVLADNDGLYVSRFANVVNNKYSDRIELNICSSVESLQAFLDKNVIHIILADELMDISKVSMPANTTAILMVSAPNVLEQNGYKAICKYQRVDMIYKELLGIMSEYDINSGIVRKEEGKCNVVTFTSPMGGVGNSSAAAAFVLNKVRQGHKVFYLNMETTGVTEQYFTGPGTTTFSDVLFTVKNKKSNLTMKMESDIRQSDKGVYFFAGVRNAFDLTEMQLEDFDVIMRELVLVRDYDYLVVDVDFHVTPIFEKLICNYAKAVVIVDDGSETGNFKTVRGIELLEVLEKSHAIPILPKILLMYNRFSSSKSSRLTQPKVQELGGCRRYEMSQEMQIIEEISHDSMFDKL